MPEKKNLRIGHLKITDHLLLGITKTKLVKGAETFQYGSVETVAMTGWNSIGEALMNDEIDMAFMLAPYAMELFHSGVDIKLISLAHKSGSIIVTNKRANISEIEDFKGKTVLLPYHLSVHHMLFDKLLKEKGLETGVGKDVVYEVVAPSQIPQFIEWDEDGDIGGYIVAEPFGTQVIQSGLGTEFKLSKDIWPNHPCCVVVAKNDIIQKHPDLLHEFEQSLVKSGKLVKEKPETAVKIGAAFLGQTEAVIGPVLGQEDRVSYGELMPVLEDLDTMQNYLTTEVSAMSDKIDLEAFVDSSFAKSAGAK